MRSGAFKFSDKWAEKLSRFAETGMGYTVISVTLNDGRRFDQAVVDSGYLSRVRGRPDVPFCESDIAKIEPTHEKWDWTENP